MGLERSVRSDLRWVALLVTAAAAAAACGETASSGAGAAGAGGSSAGASTHATAGAAGVPAGAGSSEAGAPSELADGGQAGEAGLGGAAGAAHADAIPDCQALPDLAQAMFEDLGALVPETISATGSTVVGSLRDLEHAAVWTHEGGIRDLYTPDNDLYLASLTNCDGSVLVAASSAGDSYRWTQRLGFVKLRGSGGMPDSVEVRAINPTGQVLVGTNGSDAQCVAQRWTGSNPAAEAVANIHGYATDVSDNGQVVVGVRYKGSNRDDIFRWSEATGVQSIAKTVNGIAFVSADGTSVLSYDVNDALYRWRANGITPLSCGAGALGCEAGLLNHDGSLIILDRQNAPDHGDDEELVWTDAHGAVSFMDKVKALGVDLGEWQSLNIVDMTPDARTFVGMAFGKAGKIGAYRLRVPAGTF
jgi:hypothetical protein